MIVAKAPRSTEMMFDPECRYDRRWLTVARDAALLEEEPGACPTAFDLTLDGYEIAAGGG